MCFTQRTALWRCCLAGKCSYSHASALNSIWGCPWALDRVFHIVEYLKWLMASVWIGSSSSPPCDFWVCFTVGQGLVLSRSHVPGTVPGRPLASLFWKARGFNGTGAECFMEVGLSPRWFSWARLFIRVDVTAVAVLRWCCAVADQHAKVTQAQCSAGVFTLLVWCRDGTQLCFLPKEYFCIPYSVTASCASNYLLIFSGLFPFLGCFEALYY